MEKKIIEFDKLKSHVGKFRSTHPRTNIILCHGCFDIVHPGHIRHLKFAKELGGFLIVSITPDICIQKDSGRPLVPQHLRAENLAVLEIVDLVTIAPGETAIESLQAIKPNIYVKGSEYAISQDPRFLAEKDLVEKSGGKVAYSSGDVVFSSTAFIRDHDMSTAEQEKLNYICDCYKITREWLNKMLIKTESSLNVLVVGEPLIDEYRHCDSIGLAQETPVMALTLKHSSQYMGGSAGLSMTLSALGANVTFLSSLSTDDKNGAFFKNNLLDAGIRFINIQDPKRPVNVKCHYYVAKNQVMEVTHGGHFPLDSNLRSKLIRKFKQIVREQSPQCVLLSDFGYGLMTYDILLEMTQYCQKKDILVISDISLTPRTRIDKFKMSDIFIVSEMELRSCMHDYESGLSVLVDTFYGTTSVKELYLLLGDGGCLYFKRPHHPGIHNMESVHIPPLSTLIEDKMGQGEAFVCGILASRTLHGKPAQSIYLGAIFTTAHCLKPGNAALTKEDIYRLLDERPELSNRQ